MDDFGKDRENIRKDDFGKDRENTRMILEWIGRIQG